MILFALQVFNCNILVLENATKKSHPVAAGWLRGSGWYLRPALPWHKCLTLARLLEQRQNRLSGLVGLSEHGGGCLLDDLRFGQVGGLFGVVGIQNSAA